MSSPAAYHSWYERPPGVWIGGLEYGLIQHLIQPKAGENLLDVGCGSGYFSSRLVSAGLGVTGLDPDPAMLDFARARDSRVHWREGRAEALPFAESDFDHAVAIASLCFVADPVRALGELWRVSRQCVVLGLLNRDSLLYWQKRNSPGYAGARWDRLAEVLDWAKSLGLPGHVQWGYAVFLPSGNRLARCLERYLPRQLPVGGFMAVAFLHPRRLG